MVQSFEEGVNFYLWRDGFWKNTTRSFKGLHTVVKRKRNIHKRAVVKDTHVDVDLWRLLDEAENPKWDSVAKKWFLLDEIQTIADGYAPPSNKYIRQLRILFSQFRKRHAKLDFVSQFPTGAHFSLRTLTNTIIQCDAKYPEEDDDAPPYQIDYYWQDIVRNRQTTPPHGHFTFDRKDLQDLFKLKLYNTFEVIESQEQV